MVKPKKGQKKELIMNSQKNNKAKVYIGLVHVKPKAKSEVLDGAKGAYVQTLALAYNSKDYAKQITNVMKNYKLDVIDIDNFDTLANRKLVYSVSEKICTLAKQLCIEKPIIFDDFHTYMNEDENNE